jgi:5-methylcytosine-specific restriction endonuclease McrA
MALKDASHRELGLQKWKDQRLRVLKRDGYICAYCGQEADQVDHVIPRKAGGTHDLDNLVACCKACNSKKGALDEGSFLGSRSTPPVFPERSLSETVRVIPKSPFIKPESIQANAE